SMYWMCLLRPCKFGQFVMTRKRIVPGFLSQMASPVSWGLDTLAAPVLRKLSSSPEDGVAKLVEEELTCETLLGCLDEFTGKRQMLCREYDEDCLNWVLMRAAQLDHNQSLHKVLLKTERQEVAGWYIYYADSSGISEVVQLYANRPFGHAVLQHLLNHAKARG